MKNIRTKFKINNFTYFLILSALCTGFLKNITIILIIVLFHELGHVFFVKYFGYKIEKIEIYPFGGITSVNKPINTPVLRELGISLGGVLFQIFLAFIFFLLKEEGIIRLETYNLFNSYNYTILFFNLLPIIPLDGSIIIHSIFEIFFSYQKSYYLYLISSLVMFFIFFAIHTLKSLNNYMILTFLVYKIYDAYKKRKHYQNRFYLERYLYEFPYLKIESHSYPDISSLKKDTLHFFWMKDRYLHEKEFLKGYYSNSACNFPENH